MPECYAASHVILPLLYYDLVTLTTAKLSRNSVLFVVAFASEVVS